MKTTITVDKKTRDDIMLLKLKMKAKDADIVIRDAIKLLRWELKRGKNE